MSIERISFPEVDCSLMNLFDKSTLYTAFYPAAAYVDFIRKSGYTGIEWHPLRNARAGRQINTGRVTQDTKDAIMSLHQSWRSEKYREGISGIKQNIQTVLEHPNPSLAFVSAVILPERVASLYALERLQEVLGKKLSVVLYPEDEGEESGTARNFLETSFQPTPGVMQRWGVRTVQELTNEVQRRGYTGFCVDLAHLRGASKGEYTLQPWRQTLPQLLPHTREIHVAAGRVDMPYQNTEEELKDLIKGTKYTELPQMLDMIKRSGWQGRIVTEIPAVALHKLHGGSFFFPIKDLVQLHTEIVYNIKAIVS